MQEVGLGGEAQRAWAGEAAGSGCEVGSGSWAGAARCSEAPGRLPAGPGYPPRPAVTAPGAGEEGSSAGPPACSSQPPACREDLQHYEGPWPERVFLAMGDKEYSGTRKVGRFMRPHCTVHYLPPYPGWPAIPRMAAGAQAVGAQAVPRCAGVESYEVRAVRFHHQGSLNSLPSLRPWAVRHAGRECQVGLPAGWVLPAAGGPAGVSRPGRQPAQVAGRWGGRVQAVRRSCLAQQGCVSMALR